MKIRLSILAAVAVVTASLALTVWLSRKPANSVSPIEADPNSNTVRRVNAGASQSSKVGYGSTNVHSTIISSSAIGLSAVALAERQNALSALNDVPIAFYGKLEDQFGNPVAGAAIIGRTVIYSGTRVGSAQVSTTSDDNGYFKLNAGSGESLGIVPRKKGYLLATTDTSFNYSYMYPNHFTPNQIHPTVINMWKLQGAEPLVIFHKRYKIPYTASPLIFDLLTGDIVPSGGDIEIDVHRPPGEVSEHNRQEWNIDLEVVGGGFIETSGEQSAITFAAPEAGYRARGNFSHNNGPSMIQKAFFIRSRDGKVYTKLGISFFINSTPNKLMDITIDGVASTNGSGNWEPMTTSQ